MANYTEVAVTTLGQALITKAQAGATIDLTRMQIGSGQLGGGNPAARTALISPIAYFNINSITKNENTASVLGIFENSALASSTYTCEIGLFAQDPDLGEILYAYANAEDQGDTFPPISSGPYSLQFKLNVAIGNATTVTATIPPGVYIPQSEASVDPDPNTIVQRTSGGQVKAAAPAEADDAARLTEIQAPPFVTTTGTGTTYVATFSPAFSALVPGTRITIKMNLANTGAATINVNGLGAKTILKSNGSGLTAGNLKINSVYTLVYDGINFILQGEGGEYGTAGAAQVLTGYNIGTESGLVAGTMPNNGALNYTPGQTAQNIPAGYTSGGNVVAVSFDATKVLTGTTIAGKAGTMPNNGALSYTPNQSVQTIPAGYTSGGSVAAVAFDAAKVLNDTTIAGKVGTMPNRAGDTAALASSVAGTTLKLRASNGYRDGVDDNVTITDPDFIVANIRKDINLFGLVGTLVEGMPFATGVVQIDGNDGVISGLAFVPTIIVAKSNANANYSAYVYMLASLAGSTVNLNVYIDTSSFNAPDMVTIQGQGFTLESTASVNPGNYRWYAFG